MGSSPFTALAASPDARRLDIELALDDGWEHEYQGSVDLVIAEAHVLVWVPHVFLLDEEIALQIGNEDKGALDPPAAIKDIGISHYFAR